MALSKNIQPDNKIDLDDPLISQVKENHCVWCGIIFMGKEEAEPHHIETGDLCDWCYDVYLKEGLSYADKFLKGVVTCVKRKQSSARAKNVVIVKQ